MSVAFCGTHYYQVIESSPNTKKTSKNLITVTTSDGNHRYSVDCKACSEEWMEERLSRLGVAPNHTCERKSLCITPVQYSPNGKAKCGRKCKNAISPYCHCNCNGSNHGTSKVRR